METAIIRNYIQAAPVHQDDAAALLALTVENCPGNEIITGIDIPGIYEQVMAEKAESLGARAAAVLLEVPLSF